MKSGRSFIPETLKSLEQTMNPIPVSPEASPALHPPLNGYWKLGAGRAVTLRPMAPGVLRIGQGRVWVTLNGPHERLAGDLFLEAGARLPVQAGQRVVIEPYARAGRAGAAFDWVPQTARQAWRWPAAVAQPASDLLLALGNAGYALRGAAVALARLSRALLGLAPASLGLAMAWALRRGRALCLVSSAGAS
jgi:hypothetical protein